MRAWAAEAGAARPEVTRIGYFGSYARGNWGVGSDLDVAIVVERAETPFERRGARWDTNGLPAPAEVFEYTEEEWEQGKGIARTVSREVVWVYQRAE